MPTKELTIDRLFDAPPLSGPSVRSIKISPDGRRIAYLKNRVGQSLQLDLWAYRLSDGACELLVDSTSIPTLHGALSAEERNRRERQRSAALSGILEYSFAPSGQALLFPFAGELYYHRLDRAPSEAPLKVVHAPRFSTDATVSPLGRYLAYVIEQNLHVYDLARGEERALTHDGGGAIKNAMAEFVAQEEMDRSTGYWWSPDDAHVAFIRVDESPVTMAERFEIEEDTVVTHRQRYPAAGGANVALRVGVVDVRSGATTWIDSGSNPDIYVARVDWLPDGRTVAIQRQSRDQRRLDLVFADIADGTSRVVLTERSNHWIDLHDELTFLRLAPEFVWASAADGYRHLYLYDYQGEPIRRLTRGPWNVNDFRARAIKAIDETRRLIYFVATEQSPLERHLYCASLDQPGSEPLTRLSPEHGIHEIAVAPDASFYVDSFTSPTAPPNVSVRRMDGTVSAYVVQNSLDEHHPATPFLDDDALPEFGTLQAEDGQTLHYQLFRPRDFDPGRRYPAIIDVYGGPGAQRVLKVWPGGSFTQILTRAGYVVFQLDNRGSAFRGSAFQSPIRGTLGHVEVADQVRGARWLASQPGIDPARIGVWGWSYGGYLTLMLMFKAPEVFRAGVAGAPVTDWALYDTHYTERYLGMPQDNAAGYLASSVLTYAEGLRGRLLVMHGMADDNVLFLHSTKLFRKLQDLGKPFDVMVYPGAKHGLLRQHDGRHAYRVILGFFDDHLQPRERGAMAASGSASLTG